MQFSESVSMHILVQSPVSFHLPVCLVNYTMLVFTLSLTCSKLVKLKSEF